MSQENVEIVRRHIEAFGQLDVQAKLSRSLIPMSS